MKFSELREYISIVDFALHCGYSSATPWAKSKRSRNYPALENTVSGDRIIINKNKNRYTEAGETRSGDLIDFVGKRIPYIAPQKSTMNEHAAVNEILHEFLNIAHEIKAFNKPVVSQNVKAGFDKTLFLKSPTLREENANYLKGTGISLSTINHPNFANKILSIRNPNVESGMATGKHYRFYNVSFPYVLKVGGDVVGYEQRNFSFKGHALGSDKESGVWLSNLPIGNKVDKVVVCESAKDCLSYHQLHQPKNTLYVSFGGHLSSGQVKTLRNVLLDLNNGVCPSIVVGFDNDQMGALFSLQLLCSITNGIENVNPHPEDKNRLSLLLTAPNKKLSQALNSFNKKIKNSPDYRDNRFYSEVVDSGFIINVPKIKEQIQFLNESIIASYGLTDVSVQLPMSKDFNDDLQHFINTGKNNSIKTPNKPRISPSRAI